MEKQDKGEKHVINKDIGAFLIVNEEVKDAAKKKKRGKATWPDPIPIEVIVAIEKLEIDLLHNS